MEDLPAVPGDVGRDVATFRLVMENLVQTTPSTKKKLIASNAAIWAAASLLSFILPMVADSIADGPAAFLKMMVHTGPLLLGLVLSSALINKSIGQTTE